MHPMLNIGVRAARKAGNFIVKNFENLDSVKAEMKSSNDFVTNVDLQAEALIIEIIKGSFPDHSIIAEESGLIKGKDSDYQWIIDPLDGTKNFMSGFPHFAVSIALRVKNRTELAIVYDPNNNELFTARRGSGAKLNNQRLRVKQPKDLTGTVLATGFPFKSKQYKESYLNILGGMFVDCADFRRTGSAALDLCYVAAARVDGYFELAIKPWDMAAGELIAREAGAICTDFAGGTNYMASGNIVAGTPRLVKAMLQVIRNNGSEAVLR